MKFRLSFILLVGVALLVHHTGCEKPLPPVPSAAEAAKTETHPPPKGPSASTSVSD